LIIKEKERRGGGGERAREDWSERRRSRMINYQ